MSRLFKNLSIKYYRLKDAREVIIKYKKYLVNGKYHFIDGGNKVYLSLKTGNNKLIDKMTRESSHRISLLKQLYLFIVRIIYKLNTVTINSIEKKYEGVFLIHSRKGNIR